MDYKEEDRYLRAEKRLKKIKGFYWHLVWYILINIYLLIVINNGLETNEEFFVLEHFITPFFWGIGLVFHWIGVFGKNIIFSKDWENRKIKEYMDRGNN